MTVALVALFYSALVLGGVLFADLFDTGYSIWFVSAVTLALGIAFAPLRRFLQAWIDQRFFPERYALRTSLIALAAELPTLGTLPRMGKLLIDRVREMFGCERATVLLSEPKANLLVTLASVPAPEDAAGDHTMLLSRDDPGVVYLERIARPVTAEALADRSGPSLKQRLRAEAVELVVPIVHNGVLVGAILLGAKVDGGGFVAEEQELLSLLAHHVATVFENARLFESATYDPLTGLLRREAILERLEEEVQRASRYGRPLSIGMADLDHFKEVNDKHGHLAGDLVLQRIAQAVRASLRGADAVGRYGGEELLFVLPETPLEDAVQVAEKIRERVASCVVVVGEGETEVRMTVSIGLATLAASEGQRPDSRDLIATADRKLLLAKRNGRDRVVAVA
jgi:diguanylate cyclase (GGDEF)-like protein